MSAMPSSVWRTNASRVLAVLVLAAGGTRAYAQLPDGPGKDVVVKVCGTCHEPARAAALRLTREGWEQTVADMRWRGAKGTDEEFAAVIEFDDLDGLKAYLAHGSHAGIGQHFTASASRSAMKSSAASTSG